MLIINRSSTVFTHFDENEKSVHYPQDRKLFIGLKPYVFVILGIVFLATIGAAWVQYLSQICH